MAMAISPLAPTGSVFSAPVVLQEFVLQKVDQFFDNESQENFKKIALWGGEFLGGAALTGVVSILFPEVLALRGLGLVVETVLGMAGGNLGYQFGGLLFDVPAEDQSTDQASMFNQETLMATLLGLAGSLILLGFASTNRFAHFFPDRPAWQEVNKLRDNIQNMSRTGVAFDVLERQSRIKNIVHSIVQTETHRVYVHPSGLIFGVKNDFTEVSPVFGGFFHSSPANRFWIESSGSNKYFNSLTEAIQAAGQSRGSVIRYNDFGLESVPKASTYVTGIHPSLHKLGSPVPVIKPPFNEAMGLEECTQDFGHVTQVIHTGREHDLRREWMNWGKAEDWDV